MATLEAAAEPLSAYAILDRLREQGLRGPAQVYRALDRLRAAGRVHRLESLNAFVACRHEHDHEAGVTVFVICDDCGHTEEVCEPALGRELSRLARRARFEPRESTVELRGRCQGCGAGPHG
ncbi:MAG: transcriptional repressor [Burkholderiaceae bacterium]